MTPSERVRPNILQIRPYTPGKPIQEVQRELGLTDVIKLASNENSLGPSPRAMRAIEEAVSEVHLYPDAGCRDLRIAIADRNDIATSQVAVGSGSDELLTLLAMCVIDPGDEIVMADPSFISYPLVAHRLAAVPKMIPLTEDERHDLPAMAAACTDKTKVVFVANPNNPTGTIVQQPEVLEFLDALPPHVLPVFDEAYYEYVTHPAYPDSLSMVKEGREIAVLRTFSKAYGLAGLRVGYMMSPPWMVDAVDRAREPFNVSHLAQVAAIAALDDATHVRRSREMVREGLASVSRLFDSLDMPYADSHANFAWVDVKRPATELFESLLRLGVIVRPGHIFGRPTHLRVTIGTTAEMARFADALVEVLRQ
jgi:histidinol-phosphate aminotransferase